MEYNTILKKQANELHQSIHLLKTMMSTEIKELIYRPIQHNKCGLFTK